MGALHVSRAKAQALGALGDAVRSASRAHSIRRGASSAAYEPGENRAGRDPRRAAFLLRGTRMNRIHRTSEPRPSTVRARDVLSAARHPVGRFVSSAPHSIGKNQTLETAHAMMRDHGIRHLPVLERGKLAGILSQRDLYFVESLSGVDPRTVLVEEAMSPDTYSVSRATPIEEVATEMAEHKYGCAVVMDGPKVVGIFTTTDALHALGALLENARRARPA